MPKFDPPYRLLQALRGSSGIPSQTNPFVTDDDPRNTNARTAAAHATSHQSGGADAVKLDDLATPDDNTDLDSSTTRHGLALKLSGNAAHFYRGDGVFAAPPTWQGEPDVVATGATRTQVPDSATDVLLLAANTLRVSAVIHNSSSAVLRVALGTVAASLTNYSFLLQPNETEVVSKYTGQIRGIWDSDPGDGEAKITERTADSATAYSATATRTQKTAAGTDAQFLAPNAARRSLTVFNDNAADLYLGEGITAVTASNFSHLVQANRSVTVADFTGELRGMWAAGFDGGKAYITERT